MAPGPSARTHTTHAHIHAQTHAPCTHPRARRLARTRTHAHAHALARASGTISVCDARKSSTLPRHASYASGASGASGTSNTGNASADSDSDSDSGHELRKGCMQRKRRLQHNRHAGDASGANERLCASDAEGASDAAAVLVATQARHAQGWWGGDRATRAHTRTCIYLMDQALQRRTQRQPTQRGRRPPL
jgi:hypothetical protein